MTADALIVDSAHVISLPERADRRAAIAAGWPYGDRLPLQFFDATVNSADPTAGCLDSHLRLLEALAANRPALVLEDDAVFADAFTLHLAVPADWRVLWLGRQKLSPEGPVIDGLWARPWRIARTHAYAVRGGPDLALRLRAQAPRSIDPALSQLHLPQYMLRTATVGQAAGVSDITGQVRPADQFFND